MLAGATRLGHFRPQNILRPHRRLYVAPPPSSRIARIESRLPKFLRHITTPLRTAPISHITSFLLLHELTAFVPLIALAGAFHYYNWLPPYLSEGKWFKEGAEKFGRYLRKKGWISEDGSGGKWWGRGEGGVRIVVELATAYAVVKLLLPVRLVVSVWGTPWFARLVVLPAGRAVKRVFWRTKKGAVARPSPAAGTGATGGGVVSKEAPGKAAS